MRIKQLIPVTNNYAVLATRKSDFADTCYDQQDSGHSFFWAVLDEEYKDSIALIDVDVNSSQRICDRCPAGHNRHQQNRFYGLPERHSRMLRESTV